MRVNMLGDFWSWDTVNKAVNPFEQTHQVLNAGRALSDAGSGVVRGISGTAMDVGRGIGGSAMDIFRSGRNIAAGASPAAFFNTTSTGTGAMKETPDAAHPYPVGALAVGVGGIALFAVLALSKKKRRR